MLGRTIYTSCMLSLLLLIAYLLFRPIQAIQSLIDTITTTTPTQTAPVSYFTDAQNAELVKWEDALLGKKIGQHNDATTFAEADLPPRHRLNEPLFPVTADFVPERLSIRRNKKGIVVRIHLG